MWRQRAVHQSFCQYLLHPRLKPRRHLRLHLHLHSFFLSSFAVAHTRDERGVTAPIEKLGKLVRRGRSILGCRGNILKLTVRFGHVSCLQTKNRSAEVLFFPHRAEIEEEDIQRFEEMRLTLLHVLQTNVDTIK